MLLSRTDQRCAAPPIAGSATSGQMRVRSSSLSLICVRRAGSPSLSRRVQTELVVLDGQDLTDEQLKCHVAARRVGLARLRRPPFTGQQHLSTELTFDTGMKRELRTATEVVTLG